MIGAASSAPAQFELMSCAATLQLRYASHVEWLTTTTVDARSDPAPINGGICQMWTTKSFVNLH